MRPHLHSREYLDEGEAALLNCDTQCNFMLFTDNEYRRYKSGSACEYYGGHFKYFPAELVAPFSGNWNVVIDLGGGSGNVKHSLKFIKNR